MATETKREKTKICCIDLPEDIVKSLSERFDVFDASMGYKINVEGLNNYGLNLLPNYNLPDNIQEYEVFIQDLKNERVVQYNEFEHKYPENTHNTSVFFISNPPQTVYDFRPYGSNVLKAQLNKFRNRPAIKIIFIYTYSSVEYRTKDTSTSYGKSEKAVLNNYMHFAAFNGRPSSGREVALCESKLSKTIFESFLNDIEYCQVFEIPQDWDGDKYVASANVVPLLQTKNGEVVSYLWCTEKDFTLVLPQTTRKQELLDKVLQEICFTHFSDYFPEVAESAWINKADYFLPNQASLIDEKEQLRIKYEEEVKAIDKKISENDKKYSFLHDLITGTDDVLVHAVMKLLFWLGFKTVIDKDNNLDKDFNEEDIQVNLGNNDINGIKLLVIECKGIGGTSTDSQCSQISKVVHRRGKERNAYDVHGLYIVNNQMHIEPLSRQIPPFNPTQISDAENDERGLCYTWQLYNLYFNIELGIISKDEARLQLFQSGLVQFTPRLMLVGTPHKYYHQHTVACIVVHDCNIHVGDYFYYQEQDRWCKVKIISIQDGAKDFEEATDGSFGFGLENRVPNNVELYIFDK